MKGQIINAAGQSCTADKRTIADWLARSEFFWLDVTSLDQDGPPLLRDVFGFHELAVEDAEQFDQRPKLDVYDDFVLLVVYGAAAMDRPIEVHCFYSQRCLVTVRRGDCPALSDMAARLLRLGDLPAERALLLYHVVDALVDSFFPLLDQFDDTIDQLEDDILERPSDAQLGRLFDMKRALIALRKIVTPERDMFAALLSGPKAIPDMTPETERYFRDVYDHLIRISDLVDSYRDLLSGAMDTHLSTVSNRLNRVMKQLTIIATIFLPLTFITGFFGQNFGWMVDRLASLPVFLGVGIGLQVLTLAALLVLFQRRGWFSSGGTA